MMFVYNYILRKKRINIIKYWNKKRLIFRTKNICLPKILLNHEILIHQGKSFVKRKIYPFMINHKIGEFVLTRKPFFYPPKKKKKR